VELALAGIAFRHQLAYKSNWVLGTAFGALSLFIGLTVWSHLIGAGEIAGYDWPAMKAYLVIGFLSVRLVWAGSEWQMAGRILDGSVAIDLTRPVDFQRARAAEYLGGMASAVPVAVIGTAGACLLFRPAPPESAAALALTAASLLLLFPLAFGVNYLAVLLCFLTKRFFGIQWAKDGIITFFSGMMVPIAIMPGWLETTAWALPFVHFTTTPASIYLGRVGLPGALGLLAAEAAWALGLWFLARLLWAVLVRKVTIHGG
jgi:viologen exporter family transport system permease protein